MVPRRGVAGDQQKSRRTLWGITAAVTDHHHALHPITAALGVVIRRERLERDLTLKDLARRAGTAPAYLSEIERGWREPSLNLVARIAAALYQPASELIAKAERL